MRVGRGLTRFILAGVVTMQAIVAASAALAQAGTDDQTDASQTALVGNVVLSTRCPVPTGDEDGDICPSVGYASTLTIRSVDGSQELAQVATDANGDFSIPLDPGVYLVQALSSTSHQSTPQTLLVTVSAESPTPLTIRVRTAR